MTRITTVLSSNALFCKAESTMLGFDNQVVERFKKFRFGVKSVVPTITGSYPIESCRSNRFKKMLSARFV
ncbi:MAG: hypothetical protein PVF82_18845 [Gammaproteobacteria bacterium]